MRQSCGAFLAGIGGGGRKRHQIIKEREGTLLVGIFRLFFFTSLHVFCVLHMYVSLVLKGNNKKNGNQLCLKQKRHLLFVLFSRLFTFSGL